MKAGDAVKVRRPWAYNAETGSPDYHWFGGYSFVCHEQGTGCCFVSEKDGPYAGMSVRYAVSDVALVEVAS